MENNKDINKNITDNTTISILYLNNKKKIELNTCLQVYFALLATDNNE